MDTNVNAEIQNILDCFSGEDGGIVFLRFRTMMERLKNDSGESARELEAVVKRFSKLIDIAARLS